MLKQKEAAASMESSYGELLSQVFEMSGLGGSLMMAVVVVAIPSIALVKQPSHIQSLLWFATLMSIFFSGLYLFSRPVQSEELSENASVTAHRSVVRYLKRSVLCALVSTLFFPPVFGTLALIYAVKGRKMTPGFGNFFIIIAVVAMLLGAVIGGLVSLSS